MPKALPLPGGNSIDRRVPLSAMLSCDKMWGSLEDIAGRHSSSMETGREVCLSRLFRRDSEDVSILRGRRRAGVLVVWDSTEDGERIGEG